MAYVGATAAAALNASSYRVKFQREEFLKLVEIASPDIIYKVKRIFFFAHDGFVMYTFKCRKEDFYDQNVIEGIEFSNEQWSES